MSRRKRKFAGKRRRKKKRNNIDPKIVASERDAIVDKYFKAAKLNSAYFADLAAKLSTPPDMEVDYEIKPLRRTSRALFRSNPYANSIITKKVTSVVGVGISRKAKVDADYLGLDEDEALSLNKAIDRELRHYYRTKGLADLERESNLPQLLRIVLYTKLIAGAVFVNFVSKYRRGERYRLKMQIVEPDLVSNPHYAADTNLCSGGIQRSPDGEMLGFWVNENSYEGGIVTGKEIGKWAFVPFHNNEGTRVASSLRDKTRPNQSTSVPDLTCVAESLHQIGRFNREYIQKAIIQAYLTLAYPDDGQESDPLGGIGSSVQTAEGASKELGPGTSFGIKDPTKLMLLESKTPGVAYEPFVREFASIIASGSKGLSPEIIVNKFTTSYTAAQAALMEAWRYFNLERSNIISDIVVPLDRLILKEAALSGYLDLPGFGQGDALLDDAYMDCVYVGPVKGHLRPLEKAKADELEQEQGWKSQEQNAYERGNEPVDVLDIRTKTSKR